MTMAVNVYEAKTQLSALLERVARGEDVIIAKAGKPMARLTRLAGATGSLAPNGVRFGGLDARHLKLAPDFHAPMTDADLLAP
jgi:prevent-host-death family protein